MEKSKSGKIILVSLSDKSLENALALGKILREEDRAKVVSLALEISREIIERIKNGKKLTVFMEGSVSKSEEELAFIIKK